MVDSSGDTETNVEAWCNGLAGLTNLGRLVDPSLIACDARRADGATEQVRELTNDAEVAINTPATDDDNLGFGKVWADMVALLAREEAGTLRTLGNCDLEGATVASVVVRGDASTAVGRRATTATPRMTSSFVAHVPEKTAFVIES